MLKQLVEAVESLQCLVLRTVLNQEGQGLLPKELPEMRGDAA